ncbi:hypothetical protein [Pseudoxanthomonas wuyuanensis]|nr:hypothetical protein [Pseudoxanthomonas wuyuanensis]
MNGETMHPFYFGREKRRLFGVFHRPEGTARGAVLMCPPLLHEQFRSYRFFSRIAAELAAAGLGCLRFDYFGTGDSEGEDSDFSPAECGEDIAIAAEELRRRCDGVPLILMGIRGSALLGAREARRVGACALWLWQPVTDAGRYLQTLEQRDLQERGSRYRFPLRDQIAPAAASDLMGFQLSGRFRAEWTALDASACDSDIPVAIVDSACKDWPSPSRCSYYELPAESTAWSDEVDLSGLIPVRGVRPALAALISDLPRWTAHG